MSETTARRAKKSKVDPNENREQKFVRLARTRGEKLIHQIDLLSNLGSSYAYEVSPELAEELLGKFDGALENLRAQWRKAIDRARKGNKKDESAETVETKSAEPVTSDA